MINGLADKLSILVSSILILHYISGLFFKKTKILDLIWVLGFGLLLKLVLEYFEGLFLSISPMMSATALIVILFDAGMNVDNNIFMRTMPRAQVG